MSRKILPAVVGVGIALLLFVLFFPFWQSLGYTLIMGHPELFQWLIISGIVFGVGMKVTPAKYRGTVVVILLVASFVMVIGGMLNASVQSKTMVADEMESEFENESSEIPEVSSDSMRVLPREVSDEYASSSLQTQQYGISESDPVYHNGSYQWSYGLQPDKIAVEYFGKQNGAVFVNMETERQDVSIVKDEEFDCGYNMKIFDNYNYQMTLNQLTANHQTDTRFVFQGDDGSYNIAQSFVEYEWEWSWTPVPGVHAVPRYGGTQVMDQSCNIDVLGPSEVSQNADLDKQSTYPYYLTTYRFDAVRYNNGVLNLLFVGDGVPEMAEVPTQGNEQPFVVPTESGLQMYIAAEPTSSGQGIYQMYMFDGQTGSVDRVEFNNSQLGPQRAADKVRTERPNTNWASGTGGTMKLSEPIPIMSNGTLYWHVKAVPTDSIGISFSAFVNAESGDVTITKGDEEIYAFISEDDIPEPPEDTDNQTQVTIGVINENGTVTRTEEIYVPKNGSVDISINNSETQ